jgi:hypothetical protein
MIDESEMRSKLEKRKRLPSPKSDSDGSRRRPQRSVGTKKALGGKRLPCPKSDSDGSRRRPRRSVGSKRALGGKILPCPKSDPDGSRRRLQRPVGSRRALGGKILPCPARWALAKLGSQRLGNSWTRGPRKYKADAARQKLDRRQLFELVQERT